MSNWISNAFSAVGAGLVGAAGGFLIGGPVGAMAGFGIGMFGAAAGMSGSPQAGTMGGAMMGGMVGMAVGGPVGMLAGGLLGGMFGNAVGNHFSHQPHCPPYGQYMGGGFGGGYGMPPYGMPPFGGGMGMGQGMGMGYPGGCGFPQGGFGMQMPCQGMGFMAFGGCFPPPQQQYPSFPPQYQQPQQGGGQVSGGNGQPVTYTTQGGYKVTSEGGTVRITTPDGKHTVEHSGDPHEYLDGQRVKDWDGKTRTMLLPDGTRVTMNATGPQGTIQNTTIYDGGQEVDINNTNNTFSAQFNPYRTGWDRQQQPMGETGVFGQKWNGQVVYKDLFDQKYANTGITPHYRDLAA